MLKRLAPLVVVLSLGVSSAQAAPVFFDDFTADAYGLNATLTNWTIIDGRRNA
ncbi:MAG: hypothetical protein IT182_05315 [Acidobacteria bacterium]|nr:hypothetical protein [Acidobacteriota bacterium]